ncbi:MAG TPA: hypothetical protein PKC21_03540 [Oligoflexia bacterium]|nr:hypothetical protein [Oligoflexia bacterium]HMR24409.1 hypothetical protein [Oligoflexia bacterium]
MSISATELTQCFYINKVINGLWQVSGTHGPINPIKALAQMHDFYAVVVARLGESDYITETKKIKLTIDCLG